MAETQTARITRTPGVCGGKAGIAGHRMRVLAYYYDHPQEVRDEFRREREIHEEFRRQPESVVQRKLNKAVAKRRCG